MKIIRTIYNKNHQMNEVKYEYFNVIESEEDTILVSNGFVCAINEGKVPTNEMTSEFHHVFVKDAEYGYKAINVNFK